MLDTPVINLLILLSFTYFVSSLILSSINEALFGLWLRKKILKQALEQLFLDQGWLTFVRTTLLKSPHLQSLIKAGDEMPAYIPSGNFVLAIVEQLRAAGTYDAPGLTTAIQASALPNSAKNTLLDIAAQAANFPQTIAVFETRLAEYYNNAMDRAGGWFKRKVRKLIFIFGLIMAIVLNLDTIRITNDALSDPDKLSHTADQIVAAIPDFMVSDSITIVNDASDSIIISQQPMMDTASLQHADPARALNNYRHLRVSLEQQGGLHLGYSNAEEIRKEWFDSWGTFLQKIFGILITVFAMQLGANYWFDVLNKFANIRATGRKPNGKH